MACSHLAHRRTALVDDNTLETILALIKQMEATLLGLRQLQRYVGQGDGQRDQGFTNEGSIALSTVR